MIAAAVDVERIVCDRLVAALPGVDVGTTLVGWVTDTRHLLVRRIGGQVRYEWLDESEVSVEVRAESREAAQQLTADVRVALLDFRTNQPPDAVVSLVTELRGPSWLPDPDGRGKYRLSWQIKTHPVRS